MAELQNILKNWNFESLSLRKVLYLDQEEGIHDTPLLCPKFSCKTMLLEIRILMCSSEFELLFGKIRKQISDC